MNDIPQSSAHVLVVEDETPLREAMVTFLTMDGLNVHGVGTLKAATAWRALHPVDLMILDLGLPDGDALAWLASQPAGKAGLVICSARGFAGTAPAFPRIIGASVPRPARPGQPWTGADVAAGMGLARLVESQRWRGQVIGIDVTAFKDRHVMDLLTDTGCRIVWGRAPGEEAAAEVPAAQKLKYLAYLHESCGRVDAGCTSQLDLSVDYVGSR